MSAVAYDAPKAGPAIWSRRHAEIIRISALRQLKTRYRGTFLGVLWSLGNPILMTVLYTTLFGNAFASYYGGSTNRYMFSAFIGVTVVTFFSQATTEALSSVVANGGLLNKISIDPETFPIAAIVANTFQQLLTTFPMMIALTAFITHDPIRIVVAPLVLGAIVAMVAGFGLALAALFVFLRDAAYMWGVVGFVLWMTSPVFYPSQLVPERIRPWFDLNPIGLSIAAMRDVALGHGPLDISLIGRCVAVSLGLLVVGHVAFRSTQRYFMDLL